MFSVFMFEKPFYSLINYHVRLIHINEWTFISSINSFFGSLFLATDFLLGILVDGNGFKVILREDFDWDDLSDFFIEFGRSVGGDYEGFLRKIWFSDLVFTLTFFSSSKSKTRPFSVTICLNFLKKNSWVTKPKLQQFLKN